MIVRTRPIQPMIPTGAALLWHCEMCDKYGDAQLGENEAVAGAVARIRELHQSAAPNCIGGTRFVRLVDLKTLRTRGLAI